MTPVPVLLARAASAPSVRPRHPGLTRRRFLQGSGVLFGTLAAGSVLAQLAPASDWAVSLQELSSREGRALLMLGRTLYPHAQLPDAVYAVLVKDLDASAKADAQLAQTLRAGLARLDAATAGDFAEADADRRLAAVQTLSDTPFFATVRGQCITSLYDNAMAWAVFGYEGSSFEHGGYLTRGFQDLQWLPAPAGADSPPPFSG